jgi:hypothetical protein
VPEHGLIGGAVDSAPPFLKMKIRFENCSQRRVDSFKYHSDNYSSLMEKVFLKSYENFENREFESLSIVVVEKLRTEFELDTLGIYERLWDKVDHDFEIRRNIVMKPYEIRECK